MPKITNKDRFGNTVDLEQMLKRFKKELAKEGVLDEVRKREYFIPKSMMRQLKSEKHQRLMRKLNKKSRNKSDY